MIQRKYAGPIDVSICPGSARFPRLLDFRDRLIKSGARECELKPTGALLIQWDWIGRHPIPRQPLPPSPQEPQARILLGVLFCGERSVVPVQLACRVSSSTSVTATGCSITSAATVSTAGATRFFRAAFFTGMGLGLGLALAAVRFVAFADLATLCALGRVAEFPLRRFARLGSFPRFLRLAMIDPLLLHNDTTVQLAAR